MLSKQMKTPMTMTYDNMRANVLELKMNKDVKRQINENNKQQ